MLFLFYSLILKHTIFFFTLVYKASWKRGASEENLTMQVIQILCFFVEQIYNSSLVHFVTVERRRRNNINERIQEIRTLLPGLFNDSKMSKGTILRKSVEQIRKLQSDIYQYKQRIQELESTLQQIRQ